MQTHIETNRLSLDLLTTNDDEFIISLLNTEGWIQFIGDRNVHSKELALAYINKILNTKNFYYWVVRIKDGNIPIGIISFLKREYLENFDIGFAFLPNFTGKGYAYEAAKSILDFVADKQQYHPILATTIPANINSIKLLIKLGLHFDGEIKPEEQTLHVYSNAINH